jgi:hypothetical protein
VTFPQGKIFSDASGLIKRKFHMNLIPQKAGRSENSLAIGFFSANSVKIWHFL